MTDCREPSIAVECCAVSGGLIDLVGGVSRVKSKTVGAYGPEFRVRPGDGRPGRRHTRTHTHTGYVKKRFRLRRRTGTSLCVRCVHEYFIDSHPGPARVHGRVRVRFYTYRKYVSYANERRSDV